MPDSNLRPAYVVITPVRDEAAYLRFTMDSMVRQSVLPREWILVNDGSTDATEAELQNLMKQYAWLRRVRHKQSCGQSASVRTGVQAARAPLIVTLDGDGQNDPAFIPALVRALTAGDPRTGLIAGQRVGRKASWFKKLQSRIANTVRDAVLRDGTRDTG